MQFYLSLSLSFIFSICLGNPLHSTQSQRVDLNSSLTQAQGKFVENLNLVAFYYNISHFQCWTFNRYG